MDNVEIDRISFLCNRQSVRLKRIVTVIIDIWQENYPSMSSTSPTLLLVNTIATFIQIYSVLIIIRILLTWFPTIDWYNQPFAALSQITDPYLNIFRSVIPPLGGIDISPILAILLLNLAGSLVGQLGGSTVGSF